MAVSPPQLPPEVWNRVFGYLSAADKFSVRACCKYFKKLIDHGSLWKDWVVILHFHKGSYNNQFWASLRRRKVTSAAVRSAKAKDWKQLSLSLPALTTVVMDQSSKESLGCLKNFPHLKRLFIRNSSTPLLLDASSVSQPLQLTHLSMCDVKFSSAAIDNFISALSRFKNLTSLVCHQTGIIEESVWMVYSILRCLPKLKHLSISTVHIAHHSYSRPKPNLSGQDGASALTSLELINYNDHLLPDDIMQAVPGLQTLAVFYKQSHKELTELRPPVCHLKTWLSDLPQLTTLVIVKGPPVNTFISAIPATVTNLTLRVAGISSEMLAALAAQVPNLLHLHIDPWPSHLGALTAQIPHLFPKLKSLKLRHEHVSEKDFLHLHKLQDLKHLEILDNKPHLSELTDKLRTLTNYRLQVTTFPHYRDILACPCVSQVY
ncbi:hypothetical protein PAMP_017092 [Pampus punctatissimus]